MMRSTITHPSDRNTRPIFHRNTRLLLKTVAVPYNVARRLRSRASPRRWDLAAVREQVGDAYS
jgi:hypothetical protein